MAKIPTVRRFAVEDYPDQKAWIGRFFELLNIFIINVVQALSRQLTIGDNMLGQVNRMRVRTSTAMTLGDYQLADPSQNFVDANVNTGTERITLTAHPFQTGDLIQLSTTGVLPVPFASDTNYWVIRIDANTIQLSATLAGSFAGTAINITSAAGGGTHTVHTAVRSAPYTELFEPGSFLITFKAFPVFVMLGSVVEVASNQVIQRQATSLDWSFTDGLVTINAVAGLEPGKQYDLVIYTSGG